MIPAHRKPTHPGVILLEEFLEPMGLKQVEVAKQLGWMGPRLNEIVNGRRSGTADSALAFGEVFGTGPEFWLNLQRDWNLWHIKGIHRAVVIVTNCG